MSDIAELERRITAALARIGAGLERGNRVPQGSDQSAEIADLSEALAEEKIVNAQLSERLRAIKDRDAQSSHALDAKIEGMTRQLDVQGLELQRMRKTTIQLREQLRLMREAQEKSLADPHMVNKAMLAELEALRAARSSEVAEMDEILAELTPLILEVRADA